MAQFKFRVQDIHGKSVNGVVEAVTQDVALDILNDRGYTVLALAENKKKVSINANITLFDRVKPKDMVVLSRQFSVLISATVPIVEALRILSKQAVNPLLQKTLIKIGDDVSGGIRLSEGLGKHPKTFSPFYVNMVRAGEESGKLEDALNYLAEQMERDYELSSRIKGAMIYPAAILVVLIGIAVFMMISVVPKLLEIITETGADLPLSTQILVSTSGFLQSFWWLIAIILVGLGVFFRFYTSKGDGQKQWDLIKLYIPVFGSLFKKIYLIRMTRSLSTLIAGGVNITRALSITADTVGNESYAEVIRKTAEEVENGNSIATVFVKSPIIPTMVSQIMLVGEQTGKMDTVLEKLTNFYTLEVDNTVRNLVSLLEPLIIMIMGGGVGLLVASIILPIYQVATSF